MASAMLASSTMVFASVVALLTGLKSVSLSAASLATATNLRHVVETTSSPSGRTRHSLLRKSPSVITRLLAAIRTTRNKVVPFPGRQMLILPPSPLSLA